MRKYKFKNNDILISVGIIFESNDPQGYRSSKSSIELYGTTYAAQSIIYSDVRAGIQYNILGSVDGFHLVQFPFNESELDSIIEGSDPQIYLVAYDLTKPGPMFLNFMLQFDDDSDMRHPNAPKVGKGTSMDTMFHLLETWQDYFENSPKFIDDLVRPFIINGIDI